MSPRPARRAEPPQELGALLHAAASGLTRLGDQALRPLKVTSAQWKVLVVLARHGPARVSELVRRLQHDQAATSRLVSRMERVGLVRRGEDPADARAGVVELTPRGRRAYVACDARLRAVMGGLQARLGAARGRALQELLTGFNQALEGALQRGRRTAPSK